MLSPTGFYIILAVLLLVLGIIFLYVVIGRARRKAAPPEATLALTEGGGPAGAQPAQVSLQASTVGLRLSFVKAIRHIRSYGRRSLYRVPWYLMIGEAQSGKSTVLDNVGLDVQLGEPDDQTGSGKQGVNWFFFDQGIVLDVAGDFVLRADGATSNVKGWNYLTKLLRRYRSERPLDGIILAIPASDLVGTLNQSPDTNFKLEQKAQYLYKKLVDTQKRLGLSLPVYVLVTKCDQVTGFKTLCGEIPERRNEMFGWSSPYARGFAYSPEWVSEAFQNLHRYLFQLQIEVFAERDHVNHIDEFFMLPDEIRSMRAPLQIYMDQIFKESAYHDAFFLRGIYFCGDNTGEAPAASEKSPATEQEIDWLIPQPGTPQPQARVVAPPSGARTPVFLTHLFERKIFQEETLARPINRMMLSRNRLVRVVQVISLAIPIIGLLGILVTYSSLRARERSFHNSLTRTEKDLKSVQAEKDGVFSEEQSRSREANLFDAISTMGGKSIVSPFIPGSWFSHVGEKSDTSISEAYPFIVLESLRHRLDCRTESKLVSTSSSMDCSVLFTPSSSLTNLKCDDESDPASNTMHTFIASIAQLTDNRASYQRLSQSESASLADLNQLLVYFNHQQVPATFDVHNPLFVQTLKTTVRPILRASDQSVFDRAACKVEGRVQDIYDQTFKDQSVTYDFYLGEITKTEALLSQPKNAWLANRVFEYSTAFKGLTIAAGLSEMKRALNDIAKEKFMSGDDGSPPGASSSSEPRYAHAQGRGAIVWDKAILQQAIDLFKEYDSFVRKKTYNRRDTLDSSVKRAAFNDFSRNLCQLIASARGTEVPQRSAGESSRRAALRVEIKSLQDAQDMLATLMDICRSLGIVCLSNGRDVSLRRLLSAQSASLMNDIDRELIDANLYSMIRSEFNWWTLEKPFHSYILFGATNPDELEAYLADQRERITDLARQYASPLIAFTSAQNISIRSGSMNWRAILDQLDDYDAKKPGNTVAVLENFIRSDMDKVTIDNCAAILLSSQRIDYFIRRRNELRQPFHQRCQELALNEKSRLQEVKDDEFYDGLKSYSDIQKAFDKYLAGKFPFSDLPQSEPFSEVDPDGITEFFKVLADNKVAAKLILEKAPKYNISNKEALLFLDQMEKIGTFFAAFLEKKQQLPAFDLNLRFRVNDCHPLGANQIIDWTFNIGGKRFLYREQNEKPPEGIWGYGEPLSLSLRWADDSPTIPSDAFPPQSHMKLLGQTVTVRYDNNWSLFLLLLKHKGQTKDFCTGIDVEPNTIKFEVPTQPNAKLSNILQRAQPDTIKTSAVEVFMRISLLAPGKKDPLILPNVFPTQAPVLTNQVTSIHSSTEKRSY